MDNPLAIAIVAMPARVAAADHDFDSVIANAQGKTVFFNAWGGDDKINAYIAWAGGQLFERAGLGEAAGCP